MSQLAAGSSFAGPAHAASLGGGAYPTDWPHPTSQQQQSSLYQGRYPPNTAAPYNHSIPNPAAPVAPQRPTAFTQSPFPPNAGRLGQPNSHTPPAHYPMAAPPLPPSPANPQPQQQTADTSIASPKTPQSPGAQTREQQRIALLLSINVDLLEEVNRLQQDGKGGAMSAQQQQALKNAGQNDKIASEEYVHCLRRVQSNLAYMMPHAQQGQESKMQPGPAYLTPPKHMPQLLEKYAQLKDLFPGWPGMEHRMSQSSSSPSTNPPGAAGPQANGMNNNA